MLNATRLAIGGAAVALAGGFLLTSVRPTQTDDPGVAGQQASPAASAAPLPSGCLEPVTAVSGIISFGTQDPGAMTYRDAAGGLHFRDWSYTSRLDLDDDRLDGTTNGAIDWDFVLTSGVHRGTFRVENADGAWEGPYAGTGGSTYTWQSMTELTGSGAYEGLSAILFMSNSGEVSGSLFPTVLPDCDFSAGA